MRKSVICLVLFLQVAIFNAQIAKECAGEKGNKFHLLNSPVLRGRDVYNIMRDSLVESGEVVYYFIITTNSPDTLLTCSFLFPGQTLKRELILQPNEKGLYFFEIDKVLLNKMLTSDSYGLFFKDKNMIHLVGEAIEVHDKFNKFLKHFGA